MQRNQKQVSAGGIFVLCCILLNTVVVTQGFVVNPGWYALTAVTLPLLLVSLFIFKREQWKMPRGRGHAKPSVIQSAAPGR